MKTYLIVLALLAASSAVSQTNGAKMRELAADSGYFTYREYAYNGFCFIFEPKTESNKITGLIYVFRSDSTLQATTEYKKGMQSGLEVIYHRDGITPDQTTQFVNGTYHGNCRRFDANGKMISDHWYFYGYREKSKADFDQSENAPSFSH